MPAESTKNMVPAVIGRAGTIAASPKSSLWVHSVKLSWSASTSSNVSGYNIYRAPYASGCGSFSKINSLLNTSTLYTDSAVVDGATYCYTTTALWAITLGYVISQEYDLGEWRWI